MAISATFKGDRSTAATTGTGGIHNLATSSTWVAGYEWFVIDDTSNLALDYDVSGTITVGTTPTANTEIRIYAVAIDVDGSTWPDVFDATPSAETITNAGMVSAGAIVLARSILVPAATSDLGYPFRFNLASLFGGKVPLKTAIFVTHNTAVNLQNTSGNQKYAYQPRWETANT